MTRGLSLRARVLAGMGLVVVVLVVVALLVTATTRSYLIGQVDERLDLAADRPERDIGRLPPPGGPGGPPERLSDLYEGVIGPDGELETRSQPNLSGDDAGMPDIDAEQAAEAAAEGEPITVGSVGGSGDRFRVRVTEGPSGDLYVTALPLGDVDATMSRLVTVELVATLVIVAVLAAVTWWVIRLGIRPIKRMTRTATEIAGGDLSHRVPPTPASTEAGQLGLALNHMLETLETAFAERAASQDRLRQFVADASHELRTPVTTIRGYAELYRIGGLDDRGELDEAMRRTEQEAVRMARLVDDLLALAKFDEGRPFEHRPVDLSGLVADAARDARAVDPARPITSNVDGPLVVSGDEDRLRQVIANVVGNALVHTARDVPVELGVVAVDGEARITVTDHGAGMSPDVAARVTQRFYRADPARARVRGGSGLGMAIADAAVAAHGGTIHIDSAVGRGTTVTVTLPLRS